MFVIFSNMSEKNSSKYVKRILDLYANRIGKNSWSTHITTDGLEVVRHLLRKKCTKNMSVACFKTDNKFQKLLWIVGNRSNFNENGYVPVAVTSKNILENTEDTLWNCLSSLRAFTGIAAVFHDIGKANDDFQEKLFAENSSNIYRHEWISALLFSLIIENVGNSIDDNEWMEFILSDEFDNWINNIDCIKAEYKIKRPNSPIAFWLMWIILTHHKMPTLENFRGPIFKDKNEFYNIVTYDWGYKNNDEHPTEIKFSKGQIFGSKKYIDVLKKYVKRISREKNKLVKFLDDDTVRLFVNYARAGMLFSDYYESSKKIINHNSDTNLIANTKKEDNVKKINQFLDEHLINVSAQSMKVIQSYSAMCENLFRAYDVDMPISKNDKRYNWQEIVTRKIRGYYRKDNASYDSGVFCVNMAGTGCGKTLANAKIMRALSSDNSLRYTVLMGLRSLTLQTGDAYRKFIGMSADDIAVYVGSEAYTELYNIGHNIESDSIIDYVKGLENSFLQILFEKEGSLKKKKILFKPVLVSTIDTVIGASEKSEGTKYLLPFLRIMTSDVIIDEIDDFDVKDLYAVSRFIFLVGMLGRKIIISSATIPPDLAFALFKSYEAGRRIYSSLHGIPHNIVNIFCDEFSSKLIETAQYDVFKQKYNNFIKHKVEELAGIASKRKAKVINYDDKDGGESCYFEQIVLGIKTFHENNSLIDKISDKRVSIGCIKLSRVDTCIKLGEFLNKYAVTSPLINDTTIIVNVYHSRQIMLLRSKQEEYLDKVLNRKNEYSIFEDDIIRSHIEKANTQNVIFVVVATPVEETGRDHDFDWCIMEPSSYRSIIQMAGRVRRHRDGKWDKNNIGILQYNFASLNKRNNIIFQKPGYESNEYMFESHDIKDLIDFNVLKEKVDATARIMKPKNLNYKRSFVGLEHKILEDFNDDNNKGYDSLAGNINEFWWMTGMMQNAKPFRQNQGENVLYAGLDNKFNITFYEYDNREKVYKNVGNQYIDIINTADNEYWWINLDFKNELFKLLNVNDESYYEVKEKGMKYGEIRMYYSQRNKNDKDNNKYVYSQQCGAMKNSKK